MASSPDWKTKVAERQKVLAGQIPEAWQVVYPSPEELPCVLGPKGNEIIRSVLTPLEVAITTTSVATLLQNLREQTWTAEQTMVAFCKRAALAQQALECATDLLFDEALAAARALDQHLATTGKPKGPLHGLPMSVKDAFDIKGHLTSSGLVSRLDQGQATDDALLVSILRGAGAIPFVKTNVSQGCLLVESINNIYGTVRNPHNRLLSAGGSSGGEGALVAFRGSPFGLGADGGGSLRIPAAWNGLYTLKPTASRIPGPSRGVGYSTTNSGNHGPFTHDIASLRLFCEVVLAAEPWLRDPFIVPMPWNASFSAPPVRPLRLGLLFDDSIVNLSPPMRRCILEAAERLRAAGHAIVDLDSNWSALYHKTAGIAFSMYTEEGGIAIREELDKSGEPLVPRVCTGWSEQPPASPMAIWENHRARNDVKREFLERFQQLSLDAVVTAPMPHPAPPHGEYITSALCAVYNALDVPACVVPFGSVDAVKDVAPDEFYTREPYLDMPKFPYDRYWS
ncbi:hypothetical protein SEUCBS139899_003934 [Sporothrix eucalyptigena]